MLIPKTVYKSTLKSFDEKQAEIAENKAGIKDGINADNSDTTSSSSKLSSLSYVRQTAVCLLFLGLIVSIVLYNNSDSKKSLFSYYLSMLLIAVYLLGFLYVLYSVDKQVITSKISNLSKNASNLKLSDILTFRFNFFQKPEKQASKPEKYNVEFVNEIIEKIDSASKNKAEKILNEEIKNDNSGFNLFSPVQNVSQTQLLFSNETKINNFLENSNIKNLTFSASQSSNSNKIKNLNPVFNLQKNENIDLGNIKITDKNINIINNAGSNKIGDKLWDSNKISGFSSFLDQNKNKLENILNKIYNKKYVSKLNNLDLNKINLGFDQENNAQNAIDKLGIKVNLEKSVKKLKVYLNESVLPVLIDYHYCNLEIVNNFLNNYNIQISISLETCLKISNIKDQITERLSNINIYNLNFNSSNYKNSSSGVGGSSGIFSNMSKSAPEILYIFWADSKNISFLIEKIKMKLSEISSSSKFSKSDGSLALSLGLSLGQGQSLGHHKPKKEVNTNFNAFTNFQFPTTVSKVNDLEDSLTKLSSELSKRISFNGLIFSDLKSNIKTEEEYLIIMDYSMSRISELHSSQFKDYSTMAGGQYGGQSNSKSWISFFPTDAVLIGSLLLKQLSEAIVESENISKSLLLSYPVNPIKPKSERVEKYNNSACFIYHVSDERTESYFNVIYNDSVVNCDIVSF